MTTADPIHGHMAMTDSSITTPHPARLSLQIIYKSEQDHEPSKDLQKLRIISFLPALSVMSRRGTKHAVFLKYQPAPQTFTEDYIKFGY